MSTLEIATFFSLQLDCQLMKAASKTNFGRQKLFYMGIISVPHLAQLLLYIILNV